MASTFAVESGHKVARLLKYFDGPPYNIPELLDEELAEIREVLNGLRTINGCWCSPMASASLSPLHHSEPCQRTSVLYEKLRVDK
jgi:hypothetical protein